MRRRGNGPGGGVYRLLRPLLFALPPEAAHAAAMAALRLWGGLPGRRPGRGREVLRHCGVGFANRIGLAAGFDKDAVALAGLARLGFGFLEVGTVTPRPQPGSPRPRLFRLGEDRALVNRMGFNSAGARAVAAHLARARRPGVPVGVNIGRNRDTPAENSVDDYLACFEALSPHADYITVNVSSPNTPGLRDLQAAAEAGALTRALIARRGELRRQQPAQPLLVKLAPDLSGAALDATADAVLEAGADGFVATNTTLARPPSLRSPQAAERGGLSGAPLRAVAVDTVRRLRSRIGAKPLLIGVGGVGAALDAQAMFDAGADLVQIYSALVFEGPGLVRKLVDGAPLG